MCTIKKSLAASIPIDLARTGSWFIIVLGVVWQWWLLCCWNRSKGNVKTVFSLETHSNDNRNLCSKSGHFHIWAWNWLSTSNRGSGQENNFYWQRQRRNSDNTLIGCASNCLTAKQLAVPTEFWSPSTGNPIGKQPELGLHRGLPVYPLSLSTYIYIYIYIHIIYW